MAEKRRFIDVWIVESNTVYQEVPFSVVADWVQQGRLLEDDMIKPSDTKDWARLGASPDFVPYLPKPEPFRAEDQAEALEPVHMDFAWKHRHEGEDDDVDMIPLIDVSLVLLIFFMLTASAVSAGLFVPTPETRYGSVADSSNAIRVDIDLDKGDPVYSVALGDKKAAEEDSDIRDFQRLLERLRGLLPENGQKELVINAHKDLKARYTRELLVALRAEPFRSKINVNYYGVSETEQ
jgi:biopolymer transport protein ExbD